MAEARAEVLDFSVRRKSEQASARLSATRIDVGLDFFILQPENPGIESGLHPTLHTEPVIDLVFPQLPEGEQESALCLVNQDGVGGRQLLSGEGWDHVESIFGLPLALPADAEEISLGQLESCLAER